jgi:hypothetical protein
LSAGEVTPPAVIRIKVIATSSASKGIINDTITVVINAIADIIRQTTLTKTIPITGTLPLAG